jgi:RNA polymerase sigma-70 factor (ECF subfamily)
MMGNEADAEDMLQNAFVDVFLKIDSYRSEATIGAWIKRIVINTCINHLKKRRLNTTEWDDRIGDKPVEENYVTQDAALNVDIVRKAMTQLPDGYRTVFSLYLIEGYDHKEIADIIGITEATSKSQFSRAKKKMREILAEYVE